MKRCCSVSWTNQLEHDLDDNNHLQKEWSWLFEKMYQKKKGAVTFSMSLCQLQQVVLMEVLVAGRPKKLLRKIAQDSCSSAEQMENCWLALYFIDTGSMFKRLWFITILAVSRYKLKCLVRQKAFQDFWLFSPSGVNSSNHVPSIHSSGWFPACDSLYLWSTKVNFPSMA